MVEATVLVVDKIDVSVENEDREDENELDSWGEVIPVDPVDVPLVCVVDDTGSDDVKVVDADSVAGDCDEACIEEGDVINGVETVPALNENGPKVDVVLSDVPGELDATSVDDDMV